MAAWARKPTSFSSLPTTTTTPSSTRPSSSASLSPPPPPPLLDLADQLWFHDSVLRLRLPSISLSFSCFPFLRPPSPASPPDSSTLLAQCMYDGDRSYFPIAVPHHSSAASSSLPPSPDPEEPQFGPSWYLPAPRGEDFAADRDANGYSVYDENPFYGHSSMTDSDEDESYYRGYPHPGAGDDEEAYHYYTAASDWDGDDEDMCNGYPAASDHEDEEQPANGMTEELPELQIKSDAEIGPEDALSGIYDVAALLKDQHYEGVTEMEEEHSTVSSSQFLQAALSQVSAMPHFPVSSRNDQADMKESLKIWAHAVASTLPWKAAAQARPLL